MRRALLAFSLLLSGCSGSGFWDYERDTLTLPGANPNRPPGTSETYGKVLHGAAEPAPMLTDAGDVWPSHTQGVPTLKDLQRQQNVASETGNVPTNPLPPLPTLPGYDIAQQPLHAAPVPNSFPGGIVPLPGRNGVITGGGEGFKTLNAPGANGSIMVPNGNGTSTVIGPNGTVTTIPTPK